MSSGGGTRPVWSRDGRELFYLKIDGTLVAIPVESGSGPGFLPAVPKRFSRVSTSWSMQAERTTSHPFLMIKSAATAAASSVPQLVVVLNWSEELKRLVPLR